ncbi:RNA polymerase sigma factor [Arthrobacter sp. 24S4-2]|uniref:RNA polymerase sigma factor n=1 Tax=Arthrobacter sp. 24S4-2 TaxID=2575374 RepID=UPI00158623B7|nr:sigma-70 family RNA polymerase sigma factor [Arthrobacter sp. 24S4-2]
MDASGLLYQAHRKAALAFARSIVRDTNDAEDVFHEAFTKTIQAITNGAGPSENFLAYLNTAVRTTAAGWWKRNSRELPVETGDLDHCVPRDPRDEEDLLDHAAYEHVIAALLSLPERWQKVLWYADVLQHKPRHIATLMGITPNAASALILRARNGLRGAYADMLKA